jgi:hypothetical protein
LYLQKPNTEYLKKSNGFAVRNFGMNYLAIWELQIVWIHLIPWLLTLPCFRSICTLCYIYNIYIISVCYVTLFMYLLNLHALLGNQHLLKE